MENLNAILLNAANLLLVGMAVVFMFLGLLILCINLMSKFFAGEAEQAGSERIARPSKGNNSQARNAQVTAAISAAIHQHRQK